MSSSLGFLAYLMNSRQSQEALNIRKNNSEIYFSRLNRGKLHRTEVGDSGSGFIAWSQDNQDHLWQSYIRRGSTGIAWLHVPSIAGGPESGVDEWALANDVLDGRRSASEIGAPFGVARWRDGQLDIANDMLGMVRLFHFSFQGGDIWTTRPGLAHVFMGEVPKKNQLAWSGMATLGWATSGSTQLGDGRQLHGGSRVTGGYRGEVRFVTRENDFTNWLSAARTASEPHPQTSVREMEAYMSTAKRWPKAAVADLSGGKDSRVVAAIGIRSGAVKNVRTVATDHGEVETAQRLMTLIGDDVTHLVVPRKDPSQPGGGFVTRVQSQHRAWEGRYLATTAYNSTQFKGFGVNSAPRFNGLGGESMAGGNLLGTWYDRLIDAESSAALDRLVKMAKSGLGVSSEAKDIVAQDIMQYVQKSESLGISSAAGVMDIFYHLDKMPNWSVPYATPNVITPLFAPSLLDFAVRRTGSPLEYGESHRRLLREVIPEWADVPFYKPLARKRAMPFMWENGDWKEIRDYVSNRIDQLNSFDPDVTRRVLSSIECGEATKREEIFLQRFVWESTFEDYVEEVAAEARATAESIAALL